jgi:hypothetical protein
VLRSIAAGVGAVLLLVGLSIGVGFAWSTASVFGTALGTTLLAIATLAVAYSTRQDVRASQQVAEAAVKAEKRAQGELERRPRLTLEADDMKLHSQIELDEHLWVRLLVRNEPGVRAANGTRVLLAHYRTAGGKIVTMGSPTFGWTSVEQSQDSVVVFPGASRVLDLGFLHVVAVGREERRQRIWALELVLPQVGRVAEDRQRLRVGPALRLVVGADDADAQFYDVLVSWNETAESAAKLVDSLAVKVVQMTGPGVADAVL